MNISEETADYIMAIELGIANAIDDRGRNMTPAEIASTITAQCLTELHSKLIATLDMSKADRLELALSYRDEAQALIQGPDKEV